jgi:type IV pilus assembly protein PilW
MSVQHLKVHLPDRQRGFTLIEILIALLIGVFMLGALLTIVQANRQVFGDQSQLAQLQDSERMALTQMTDIIQMAGYFPNPALANSNALLATPATPFLAGQFIAGNSSTTVPGDSIAVRYVTANNDNILNCSGLPNTSGANVMYVNTFQVVNGQLVCTLTTSANPTPMVYSLVSGVTNRSTNNPTNNVGVVNLSIFYGVNTGATPGANNVDTYMTAAQLNATPTLWNSVISALIELTFTNPLYTNGSTQPQTIEVQRVVGIMNQMGPVN